MVLVLVPLLMIVVVLVLFFFIFHRHSGILVAGEKLSHAMMVGAEVDVVISVEGILVKLLLQLLHRWLGTLCVCVRPMFICGRVLLGR